MYILFNNNEDTACGINNVIQPFTSGLFVNDIKGLTKEYTYSIVTNKYNARKEQLYLNKDGAVTTNSINNVPLTETKTVTAEVSILEKPSIFNKIDVMKFKQKQMLKLYQYDCCLLYEFNLQNYIDINNTENCLLGINEITLLPSGLCKTIALPIPNSQTVEICADTSSSINILYSFDGDGYNKSKRKIQSTSNVIYLCFKNNTKEAVTLYGYQVLYNVVKGS